MGGKPGERQVKAEGREGSNMAFAHLTCREAAVGFSNGKETFHCFLQGQPLDWSGFQEGMGREDIIDCTSRPLLQGVLREGEK